MPWVENLPLDQIAQSTIHHFYEKGTLLEFLFFNLWLIILYPWTTEGRTWNLGKMIFETPDKTNLPRAHKRVFEIWICITQTVKIGKETENNFYIYFSDNTTAKFPHLPSNFIYDSECSQRSSTFIHQNT